MCGLVVCTAQLLVFRLHKEKVIEVAECTLGLGLPVVTVLLSSV